MLNSQNQNKTIQAFINWISDAESNLHWKLIGFVHAHAHHHHLIFG